MKYEVFYSLVSLYYVSCKTQAVHSIANKDKWFLILVGFCINRDKAAVTRGNSHCDSLLRGDVEFKSPGGDWLRRLLDLFCLTFISNSHWEELTPLLPLSPISALYLELVCCSAFAAAMLCFTFLDFGKEFCWLLRACLVAPALQHLFFAQLSYTCDFSSSSFSFF